MLLKKIGIGDSVSGPPNARPEPGKMYLQYPTLKEPATEWYQYSKSAQ